MALLATSAQALFSEIQFSGFTVPATLHHTGCMPAKFSGDVLAQTKLEVVQGPRNWCGVLNRRYMVAVDVGHKYAGKVLFVYRTSCSISALTAIAQHMKVKGVIVGNAYRGEVPFPLEYKYQHFFAYFYKGRGKKSFVRSDTDKWINKDSRTIPIPVCMMWRKNADALNLVLNAQIQKPVYVDMTKAGTGKSFGVVQSTAITQIQIVGPLRLQSSFPAFQAAFNLPNKKGVVGKLVRPIVNSVCSPRITYYCPKCWAAGSAFVNADEIKGNIAVVTRTEVLKLTCLHYFYEVAHELEKVGAIGVVFANQDKTRVSYAPYAIPWQTRMNTFGVMQFIAEDWFKEMEAGINVVVQLATTDGWDPPSGPIYRAQLAKHDVAYPKIELRLYATEVEARQATGVRGADIKWFLAGQAAYNPDTDNIIAKPVAVRFSRQCHYNKDACDVCHHMFETGSLSIEAVEGELKNSIALVNASDVTCIESMHRLSLKLQDLGVKAVVLINVHEDSYTLAEDVFQGTTSLAPVTIPTVNVAFSSGLEMQSSSGVLLIPRFPGGIATDVSCPYNFTEAPCVRTTTTTAVACISRPGYDCQGKCILKIDCAGECGGKKKLDKCGVCAGDNTMCTGCMNATACNYDPRAKLAGECIMPRDTEPHCGQIMCENDDDDGCTGCMDKRACNYNPKAKINDITSCTFELAEVDCAGNCKLEVDCWGVCGGSARVDKCGQCGGDNSVCGACNSSSACNYEPNASVIGPLSVCVFPGRFQDCKGNCKGQKDCRGICNGQAFLDVCGVCEGDGSSCLNSAKTITQLSIESGPLEGLYAVGQATFNPYNWQYPMHPRPIMLPVPIHPNCTGDDSCRYCSMLDHPFLDLDGKLLERMKGHVVLLDIRDMRCFSVKEYASKALRAMAVVVVNDNDKIITLGTDDSKQTTQGDLLSRPTFLAPAQTGYTWLNYMWHGELPNAETSPGRRALVETDRIARSLKARGSMWEGRRANKMTYTELTVRLPFITTGSALQLGASQTIIDTGNEVDVAPEGGSLPNSTTTKPIQDIGSIEKGGYSEWSDWTKCDKSCFGIKGYFYGSQSRSRTCTSPKDSAEGCEINMYGTKMTRQCNVEECPNDVDNFLTVSLELEHPCDLSNPKGALEVKNYLEGFRRAVAKVLELDLEKVHVSDGDTVCKDKSHIQLKLFVAVQDLDASETESKIMNHFEGDTKYRISDGSYSIAANKKRYNYKEIEDDRQELVIFLSIGGAIIAILSIAVVIWAIRCWRRSVRRKMRVKVYNQNEMSCQTDDADVGESYEKMGEDSYMVANNAVGTANAGSSGPKSKSIGDLRPGTAERVVREELARMQSHSSERTLIANPRSLSRSRTNIMTSKPHQTVNADSSTGTGVEMLEIRAGDSEMDEVPTVLASDSSSTLSPSRISTNKLRMAWKRGSAFNRY